MNPNGRAPTTEAEYWRDYEIIKNDVHAATVVSYTHRALNYLVASDQDIYARVNANPEFWQATSSSLQNTMFILLARILDHGSGVHSVHKVLAATIEHPEFFSKSARRARVVATQIHWSASTLADFDRMNTWEPTADLLKTLTKDLRPHKRKFEAIYRDIRHEIVHLISKDQGEIADLYDKTSKADIDALLQFLHNLVGAIDHMANHGQPPNINEDTYGFKSKANRIMKETEEMLRNLYSGQ